jgi:hypothetical protein
MKKVSAKEVLTSNGNKWIITNVLQGYNGQIRINAKTRFHVPDEENFFSKWVSKAYANRIRRNEGLKPLQELNCYH